LTRREPLCGRQTKTQNQFPTRHSFEQKDAQTTLFVKNKIEKEILQKSKDRKRDSLFAYKKMFAQKHTHNIDLESSG
jgi:hypothetical protein